MMIVSREVALPASLCLLLLLAAALPETGRSQSPPVATQPQRPLQPIVYRPPLRGAPVTRVGGASRGLAPGDPVLSVLAPESTGLTHHARPTLYWYASTAFQVPLEFSLNDDHSIKPLIEMKVRVLQPGLQALHLPITLLPNREYQWAIAAIMDPDQRAKDLLSSGTIQRVDPPLEWRQQLQQTPRREQPALYARAGFWYDALSALCEHIDAHPLDDPLIEQRASLLEQAGLVTVAAPDRLRLKKTKAVP